MTCILSGGGGSVDRAIRTSVSPCLRVIPLFPSSPCPRRFEDQKSICTPIFKNRGVNTDVGAIQACDPVVVAGLKLWL